MAINIDFLILNDFLSQDADQLNQEIHALEFLSQQLFLDLHEIYAEKVRICFIK
jgi:hypothetical protein